MRADLTPADVERLFVGALDGSLPSVERAELDERLKVDGALRARFEAYRSTVRALRRTPSDRAPDGLASLVLRRSRRRRFQLRRGDGATFRVPAEVLIPLLLAALVALYMLLAPPG